MAGKASECDWDSCLSAVNLEDATLFICSESVPAKIGATPLAAGDLRERFPRGACFALTAHNPGDQLQSSARNSLTHAALERDLISCKPSEVQVLNSFALLPDGSGSRFERGFFLVSPCHQSRAVQKVVSDLALKYGQSSYFRYVSEEEDGDVIQQLVETTSGRLMTSSRLVSVSAPKCPPMFVDPSYNSVFHGIKKIGDVLNDLKVIV